jgi:hypothetical protein
MPVSSNGTRVPSLHTATWVYFTSRLPYRFIRSPKVVQEAIMTDINDLVQEFLRTSRDGADGAFFAMRRLFGILQKCYNLKVCYIYIYILRLPSTYLVKMYRCPFPSTGVQTTSETNLGYCLMGIERCSINYFVIPKVWATCSGSYLVL